MIELFALESDVRKDDLAKPYLCPGDAQLLELVDVHIFFLGNTRQHNHLSYLGIVGVFKSQVELLREDLAHFNLIHRFVQIELSGGQYVVQVVTQNVLKHSLIFDFLHEAVRCLLNNGPAYCTLNPFEGRSLCFVVEMPYSVHVSLRNNRSYIHGSLHVNYLLGLPKDKPCERIPRLLCCGSRSDEQAEMYNWIIETQIVISNHSITRLDELYQLYGLINIFPDDERLLILRIDHIYCRHGEAVCEYLNIVKPNVEEGVILQNIIDYHR